MLIKEAVEGTGDDAGFNCPHLKLGCLDHDSFKLKQKIEMEKIIIVLLSAILLTLGSQAAFAEENVFVPDEHCLAYKTEKTMFFLFAGVGVIGKSCEVKAEMRWNESGDQAQINVSIPVNTLDSGLEGRDEHMPEILRADLAPNISFASEWLEKSVWEQMLAAQRSEISGTLAVAGGKFPLKFTLSFTDQGGFFLIEGKLITSFSGLKVEVPTVGPGGLIADPGDYLELLVHLRSDKISGTEKIALRN